MLKLHGNLPVVNSSNRDSYLVTDTTNANLPLVLKKNRALLMQPNQDPKGYRAILTREQESKVFDGGSDVFRISTEYDYLDEGDIIRLDPSSGSFNSLYRRNS